jgi:mannan endo-1,4-beta-mannosidase
MILLLSACGGQTNSPGDDTVATNGTELVDISNNEDEDRVADNDNNTVPVNVAPVREPIAVYGAEEATHIGKVGVVSRASTDGFTGSGYVEGFEGADDTCIFVIEITATGFYDLNFVSNGIGGDKDNYVAINGEPIGTVHTKQSGEFSDAFMDRVHLEAGTHEVAISTYWGWISLDRLEVYLSGSLREGIFDVAKTLANPNASEITRRLYSFICDSYGEKFISGQYCDTGHMGKEFQVINRATGKTPAVLGIDFMDYTPSRVARGTSSRSTELAINFWNVGGIVTFCWHWNAPTRYLTGTWYRGFYTDHTDIDLAKILNGDDPEGYDLLMADIDAIAAQLVILRDAGVPILWRPIHEASGGWFWWGAAGAEAFIELYIILFERLTYDWELDNLIWVWNGQHPDWYPGDQYVDIVGEDIYPGERVYASQIAKFLEVVEYSDEPKPVHLTENSCLFDPELARRDGAMWGMWVTWGGEFVAKDTIVHTLSEQYTEEAMLIKIYNDPDVYTLENLPDFHTYPLD